MTPQTQFTPGPWEVRFQGTNVRRIATTSKPNRHIADVVPVAYDYDKAHATMEANARLIASAPSLYAALQAMLLWMEAEQRKGYPEGSMAAFAVPGMIKEARKALDLGSSTPR